MEQHQFIAAEDLAPCAQFCSNYKQWQKTSFDIHQIRIVPQKTHNKKTLITAKKPPIYIKYRSFQGDWTVW